jgi:hypothetical protein
MLSWGAAASLSPRRSGGATGPAEEDARVGRAAGSLPAGPRWAPPQIGQGAPGWADLLAASPGARAGAVSVYTLAVLVAVLAHLERLGRLRRGRRRR